jgi:hypothetical protein
MVRRCIQSSGLAAEALAVLLLAAFLITPAAAAPGRSPNVTSHDPDAVTANFLIKFLSYTNWPEAVQPSTPSAPYVIGVSCSGPLLDALIKATDVKLASVGGHPVRAIRIKNAADFDSCHLAFLNCNEDCGAQNISIPLALNALKNRPVLTVSAEPGFLDAGGQVQLFRTGPKLNFSVSAEAARQAGLNLKADLQNLSKPVPPRR